MVEPASPVEQLEQPEGSLVFETPERAQEFSERIRERVAREQETQERLAHIEDRIREAIREELAEEVAGLASPAVAEHRGEWQYTREDRETVQKYVNVAFSTDVRNAIALLMKEPAVKDEATRLRSLDLFHDTLVDHLYDEMSSRRMIPKP